MSLATKAFAGFDIDGMHVRLVVTDSSCVRDAAEAARVELDASLDVTSSDRPNSELSTLNRSFGRTVRISPALRTQLQHALDAAALTAGAVDPVRTSSASNDASWDEIELDATTVRLPAWCTVNLDATALAVTVDRITSSLAARFGCGVLISVADHVAVAGPNPVSGWQVSLASGQVSITSGTTLVTRSAAATATVTASSAVVAAALSDAAAHGDIESLAGTAERASAQFVTAA